MSAEYASGLGYGYYIKQDDMEEYIYNYFNDNDFHYCDLSYELEKIGCEDWLFSLNSWTEDDGYFFGIPLVWSDGVGITSLSTISMITPSEEHLKKLEEIKEKFFPNLSKKPELMLYTQCY